jgi:hypothetical protein
MNAEWHKRNPMPRNATVEQRIAWHLEHHEHCNCRPIPAPLPARIHAAKAAPATKVRRPRPTTLRSLLAGGDRRSIAESERAHELVRGAPERVAELVALAQDADWLVAMRATDLLEKLAHECAAWVQPYKTLFLGPLADAEQWEIRLQIVRVLPLLRWTIRERKRVVAILERDVDHPQTFVRAWALDSLAALAETDASLRDSVIRHLATFESSGSKALVARARKIRERLAKATDASRTPRAALHGDRRNLKAGRAASFVRSGVRFHP